MKKGFYNMLEKKLGKYAISNITLYLIICYAFGYLIQMVNSDFINYMTLEPVKIMHGQIWRLFTWLVIPPSGNNVVFVLIMLYFYYSIGRSLEAVWGTFRLNLYLISGMLFTIIGSFILYGIFTAIGYTNPLGFGIFFSTYYINMSLFLAYAATFPDMHVLFFFIIPIKVKYLGIVYGILLVFECIQGGIITWIVIGSSLLNFLVFFLTSRNRMRISPKQMRSRAGFNREMKKAETVKIAKHKCAVCGRTNDTNPELEFRFCSKCDGNYEYCQEHLFSHEHIK